MLIGKGRRKYFLFVFARIHDHVELDSPANFLSGFLIEQFFLDGKLSVSSFHIIRVTIRHEVTEIHLSDESPVACFDSKMIMKDGVGRCI